MVKCYECEGTGSVLGSTPEYLGFTGVIFWTGPVLCKVCQGWGQVPLMAHEQLSTIPIGCTETYCIHA